MGFVGSFWDIHCTYVIYKIHQDTYHRSYLIYVGDELVAFEFMDFVVATDVLPQNRPFYKTSDWGFFNLAVVGVLTCWISTPWQMLEYTQDSKSIIPRTSWIWLNDSPPEFIPWSQKCVTFSEMIISPLIFPLPVLPMWPFSAKSNAKLIAAPSRRTNPCCPHAGDWTMVEMGDFAPKQSMLLESNDNFYCWKQLPIYQVLLLERLIHIAPSLWWLRYRKAFRSSKANSWSWVLKIPKNLVKKMQIQKHPRKS